MAAMNKWSQFNERCSRAAEHSYKRDGADEGERDGADEGEGEGK
jgi:hypothetical protein